jgi:transcriptional regulator with XRE-family HTH domain
MTAALDGAKPPGAQRAPTGYDLALGGRLRSLREGLGLSLKGAEIYSAGQFRSTSLGTWERGERGISARKLVALAAVYGTDAGVLLTGGPAGGAS